jgi:hypothetical protein
MIKRLIKQIFFYVIKHFYSLSGLVPRRLRRKSNIFVCISENEYVQYFQPF